MRKYRDATYIPIVCVGFLLLGIYTAYPAFSHIAYGSPLLVADHRGATTMHPATNSEAYLNLIAPIIFSLLGLLGLGFWILVTITCTEEGLSKTDAIGRVAFQAAWSDLTTASKRPAPKGTFIYQVRSANGRMDIPSSESNLSELLETIRTRAPHVDYSEWT